MAAILRAGAIKSMTEANHRESRGWNVAPAGANPLSNAAS
jgi:hypothetical protein